MTAEIHLRSKTVGVAGSALAAGRVIHTLLVDRQLDFRQPRQALAAKTQFAFAGLLSKARGKPVAVAALDDVFTDDITFPAADGYLLGASLFLPRGAKRHAVLINSATDLRAVLKGLLRNHLRVEERVLANTVFPDSSDVVPTAGLVG